jgi:hypothetical protein
VSTPDEQEQARSATGDLPGAVTPDLPLEADDADVLEQAAETAPGGHRTDREVPLEAPEADAVEQAQVVDLDEDDRRE